MSSRRRELPVEVWAKNVGKVCARMDSADLTQDVGYLKFMKDATSKFGDVPIAEIERYHNAYKLFEEYGKQCYLFDPDFTKSIASEKWVDLLSGVISKYPHSCFYMRFPRELGLPADGVIVTIFGVVKDDNSNDLAAAALRDRFDREYMSDAVDHNGTKVNERFSTIIIESDDWSEYGVTKFCAMYCQVPRNMTECISNGEDTVTMLAKEIAYFHCTKDVSSTLVANMLAYICSKNADIHVSYKPAGKPRNGRSSATWHEVGYRIGAELREYERTKSERKPHQGGTVRPHMRRAHWHHYWVGPKDGPRELVLKWIPPLIIASKNGEIKEVTGHMVESNE